MSCPVCGHYCTASTVFCTPPIEESHMATDSWNANGRGTPGGGGKAARNDITGALIKTGVASNKYRDNYDRIFTKSVNPASADTIPAGKRLEIVQ